MVTDCAPLVAVLFLFCYEKDFVQSISEKNQEHIIKASNSTSNSTFAVKWHQTCLKQTNGKKKKKKKKKNADKTNKFSVEPQQKSQ